MPIANRRSPLVTWLLPLLLLGCSPPAAAPVKAPPVAPAAPPAEPSAAIEPPPALDKPEEPPPQITIRRTELYAMVASRSAKLVTLTLLLSTSEAPPPLDVPATLLLKEGEDRWTEVASVTLKKVLPGGKIEIQVDEERPGAPAAAAFRKNAHVKVQIDQQVP